MDEADIKTIDKKKYIIDFYLCIFSQFYYLEFSLLTNNFYSEPLKNVMLDFLIETQQEKKKNNKDKEILDAISNFKKSMVEFENKIIEARQK